MAAGEAAPDRVLNQGQQHVAQVAIGFRVVVTRVRGRTRSKRGLPSCPRER
jgi:hypothetical protein